MTTPHNTEDSWEADTLIDIRGNLARLLPRISADELNEVAAKEIILIRTQIQQTKADGYQEGLQTARNLVKALEVGKPNRENEESAYQIKKSIMKEIQHALLATIDTLLKEGKDV